MSRSPSTHYIGLAGERTLLARVWPGAGDPIVFLHGIFGSSESWNGFCAALDRPCVAFDIPGFGGSDLPEGMDLSSYTDDIAAGIAALGLDRFELVGHSFGGALAASLTERLGDRVTSLLLLAPAGFGRIPLAELLTAPGMRRIVNAALPQVLKRSGTVTEWSEALRAAACRATRALVTAGRSTTGLHRRSLGYDGPVTAVWGTSDHVVAPGHRRGVTTAFPQAEIVLWDGVDHYPQRARPAAVLGLLGRGIGLRSPARRNRRRLVFWPLPAGQPTPRFA